jgi:hypothetical protein
MSLTALEAAPERLGFISSQEFVGRSIKATERPF